MKQIKMMTVIKTITEVLNLIMQNVVKGLITKILAISVVAVIMITIFKRANLKNEFKDALKVLGEYVNKKLKHRI